jgi:diadenosine tetraphosphate (Ap4A) HIT family hydrolase
LADAALTDGERDELIRLCDAAIRDYTDKRGKAIWEHRAVGLGAIPGRLRYETLARAGFRCELCGVSAEERALDVDHIMPRKHGGEDTLDNFQALCWKCNTNKGAGDDTDFRSVRAALSHREPDCVFCTLVEDRIVAQNEVAVAIRDAFPVTPLHTLVMPRRHVADYFALRDSEVRALHRLLDAARGAIRHEDAAVEGFNVGVNSGTTAGQTVLHCHVHLIPRRTGDVENPRGGVRATIPGKADYGSAAQ